MLNLDELRDIAALQSNGSYFVSLYLNAVDAYVHYLRTKLAEAGSQIETVRGVGYRMGDRSDG